MRHWWVRSPEIATMVPVMDDGSGPMEYGCDVVCIAATDRRSAIVAGVAAMVEWPTVARGDRVNPFAGVTADDAACPHGVCTCDIAGCETAAESCAGCDETAGSTP